MLGTSVPFCHRSAVGHFIALAASYLKGIKRVTVFCRVQLASAYNVTPYLTVPSLK